MALVARESIVEAVVGALAGADPAGVAAHLDERSLLHVPGGSGLAGDYQGRVAICGLLDHMRAACDGTLRFATVCTSSSGPARVRLCGTISGGRRTRSLLTAVTLEATLAGAVIREIWLTCTDQSAWDAFWA